MADPATAIAIDRLGISNLLHRFARINAARAEPTLKEGDARQAADRLRHAERAPARLSGPPRCDPRLNRPARL
jgi:hypothetical protein